jgi:hypothetical protein
MARFQNLGMKRDSKQRASLARIDNHPQQQKVATARANVYEKGYAVDGPGVNDTLKEESWVPTIVSV